MENKEKYITATIEVVAFGNQDIITTSDSIPLPDDEWVLEE